MKGKGTAYGAATIINAMASGKGVAFGIDLKTEADIELKPGSSEESCCLLGNESEDKTLVAMCARRVIERFRPGERIGFSITTKSQIPPSRGLKSSSAAANAVIMATLDALGISDYDIIDMIRLGARCAIDAGVSVTGALDDACASWIGGIVFTNNSKMELIERRPFPDDFIVLIHVPKQQIRKKDLPLDRIRAMKPYVDIAYDLASKGSIFEALTLNGLCYSAALGLDPSLSVDALERGALAAGLSGSGPATIVLVKENNLEEFMQHFPATEFLQANARNGEE